MVEDIAYIPVECAYCGSSESLISPPEPFICLSCENKIELSHQSYLKEITIDKYGKHYRCPECNDVQLSMTDNYVLCFSISFLDNIVNINKMKHTIFEPPIR